MELVYKGRVLKKDTGKFIRSFNVYEDHLTLHWELTQGKICLFDSKDFDLLIQREWRAAKSRKTFYAISGREFPVFAHTYLFTTPEGLTVDHKNCNGLDNRRTNLRLATTQQQMLNRTITGVSGFIGVTERKKDGVWRAEGRIDSEHFHVGYFRSKEEAAKSWDEFMFKKFKHHDPLAGMEINGICSEPTLNFIHFNFPERLGL